MKINFNSILVGAVVVLIALSMSMYVVDQTARLQKLIVSARKEFIQKQPPRAARMLFKCLRELMKT